MTVGWRVTRTARDWRQLGRGLTGPLLRPGDEQFEALRRPATNRYRHWSPQAIARCATPTDVAHVINFARRCGLETAVRGAGHSFADHSSTTGLLIETGLMKAGTLHGDLATIGAGAHLAEIYRALHDHRVTIPAGCGPTVGIAGLTLGGGLGVLGRTYGLTCDRLTAAQIVLADGSMITCDDRSDQDLYWALRGAGAGNFGVVTALTFQTVPESEAVAFHHSLSDRRMPEVVIAWMDWMPKAPAAMAGSLVVRAPADPSISPQVHVIGAMIGDEPEAANALRSLARVAGPAARDRQFPAAPISEVKARLATVGAEVGAGPSNLVDHSASEFHRESLPASIAAALVEAVTAYRIPGRHVSWPSPQWAAPTTGYRPKRLLSSIGEISSSSSGPPVQTRLSLARLPEPHPNGLAISAGCSKDMAPVAPTRTSPTRSWPIRCRPTTDKTWRGCEKSKRGTTPTTFSITDSQYPRRRRTGLTAGSPRR
jgi:hypothetical protein